MMTMILLMELKFRFWASSIPPYKMFGKRRQSRAFQMPGTYSFCNDWYWTPISALRKHLKKTSQKHRHRTNFSNISKTLTKLLKHVKGTKQTSGTSQRHRKNISNTSNCVTKGSNTCTSWENWLFKVLQRIQSTLISHIQSAFTIITISIWHVSVWNTEKRDTKQNHHLV